VLSSFRTVLGQVSPGILHPWFWFFVGQAYVSGFFFFLIPLCPALPVSVPAWLTERMFTCPAVQQLLAWKNVNYPVFCSFMRVGSWGRVIGTIVKVLRVWKSWDVSCEINNNLLEVMTDDIALIPLYWWISYYDLSYFVCLMGMSGSDYFFFQDSWSFFDWLALKMSCMFWRKYGRPFSEREEHNTVLYSEPGTAAVRFIVLFIWRIS
jgi:hypothetical protein